MFTSEQIWNAVDVLAREHGLSASRLSIMAGLDPTALNKSKRVGNDGRPRWMSTETVAKILSVTGTTLVDFVRMVDHAGSDAAAHAAMQPNVRWLESKPRILLVDQDETFCSRVGGLLGRAGYEICLVPDFRRALEMVESGQPIDMLIVNLLLPYGVRGSALARIARMRRPDLKIVLLSDSLAVQPAEEGIGLVLPKAMDDSRLVSETARLLHS